MRSKLFLTAIILLAPGAGGQSASAHATPITYEPQASVVHERLPTRVRIHFSERIEANASGMTVLGPDGIRIDEKDAGIDQADAHFFQASVHDAGMGTYTVVWQVTSADDGHFSKGAFVFSVGKETISAVTAGQIQVQHVTTIPQAVALWLELLGQSIIWGFLLVLVIILKPLKNRLSGMVKNEEVNVLQRRLTFSLCFGIFLVLAGVTTLLVLKTFDLGALRGTGFAATFLIFLRTLDGTHALIRGGLAIMFTLVFFMFRRRIFVDARAISSKEWLLAGIAFLIVLSRTRVSHSAATAFFPALSVAITAVHLLSKELWIGGLLVISITVIPTLAKIKNLLPTAFSYAAFSRAMSVIFGVAGVTGVYIIWLDLKSPHYLFNSTWGEWFIILSLLGGAFAAVRFYHQLAADRSTLLACQNTPQAPVRTRRMVQWFPATFLLEVVIGVMLIFATSFLIITTPPQPPERFTFARHATSQEVGIDLSVNPIEPDKFLVAIADEKTRAVPTLGAVIVKLTNEAQGIGPLTVAVEERAPGRYVFSRSGIPLPGVWRIDVFVSRPEAFDAIASFSLEYPDAITTSRIDPNARSFGWFEIVLLAIALGVLLITVMLYRVSAGRYGAYVALGSSPSAGGDSSPLPPTVLGVVRSLFIAVGTTLVLSVGIWLIDTQFIRTDFEKICRRDGNFWLPSVPIRDGVALSADTTTGCTFNIGLYHLVDANEYAYFTRPRQSGVTITTVPTKPVAGIPIDLSVSIGRIERGQIVGPAEDLGVYHDRILHFVIVGEDLKTFAHVHTEDVGPVTPEIKKSAVFPLRYTFPAAGRYTILIDYVVGGRELSQQSFIEVGDASVSGTNSMEKNSDAITHLDRTLVKDIDGYRVTLEVPKKINTGEVAKLAYAIEKNGVPVHDLEPYLGAAMHIAVVRADLGRITHTHGQPYLPGSAYFQQLFQDYVKYHAHLIPDRFGPKIQARLTFPTQGLYEIFGEFKHAGRVVTTSFIVEAEE
ncbi:MAG: copper resistance protein CopC [bacterium]|nr:copper resistance protein CopC [bacterium]